MNDGPRAPKAFVIGAPESVTGPAAKEPPKRKPRAITGITFEPEEPDGDLIVMPPAQLPA